MKYAYDLTGAEIILRDMPIYDAAALKNGELLMLGTTDPDSGADESSSLVTAYDGTAASQAVDAVGILNEDTYESGGTTPDNAYSTTTGPNYGKVIINPFAVYQVEQDLTSNDVSLTSTSGTTVTIPSLEDDIDGCWVYFPTDTSGVEGSLRLLTAATSGSATMDSALDTAGTSSDTAVLIVPPLHYSLPLTADATKVESGNMQSQLDGATNIRILATYIDRDQGIEFMKPSVHNGLDDLDQVKGDNGPKFLYDIILKDHLFGSQE